MWIVEWLPEWATHAILIGGLLLVLVSYIAGKIPFLSTLIPYRSVAEVAGILLVCFGLWIEGGLSMQNEWEAKVAAAEKKAVATTVQGFKINTEIVKVVVTRDKIITKRGEDIIRYIDREVVKFDSSCTIPQQLISSHNAAALGVPLP